MAGDQVRIQAKLGDCEAEATEPQFGPGFCRGRHLVRVDVYDLAGNLRQQDFGVHEWTPEMPAEYTVEFKVRAADGSVPTNIMCNTQFPVWYGWPEIGPNSLDRNYSVDFLGVPAAFQPGNADDNGNVIDPSVYSAVGYYGQDFIGFDGVFTRTFTVKQGQQLRFSRGRDDNSIWQTIDDVAAPVVSPALPGVSVVNGQVIIDSAVTPPGSVAGVEWVFNSWGDSDPYWNTNPPYSNLHCEPETWWSGVNEPVMVMGYYGKPVITMEVSLPTGFYDLTAPANRLELC